MPAQLKRELDTWNLGYYPSRHTHQANRRLKMRKGPGKSFRKGMSIIELLQRFPDDDTAERWFIKRRWPDGLHCPYCSSTNVQAGCKHPTMPFRCREKACGRKQFSVRTRTIMEASNVGYQKWAICFFLIMSNLKSVSSMKLSRDLGVTQKTAWFMAHRIREALQGDSFWFMGPVEADETYVGGKRKNMSHKKRKALKGTGRGPAGKAIIAGVKDRATNKVKAAVVQNTSTYTLQTFVEDRVHPEAEVYTDEYPSYQGMPYFEHDTIVHSRGEYVKKDKPSVHTQGIESFWAMLKRAHKGTFHKWSEKHLQRYVNEFAARHNVRCLDTEDQMKSLVRGMVGRRIKYDDLVS